MNYVLKRFSKLLKNKLIKKIIINLLRKKENIILII